MADSKNDSIPPEAVAFASRMFDAARNGQLDVFEQALPAGLSANLTNDKGDGLIMLASYHGHASLVSLLLNHGGNPNSLNDRGQTPLAGAIFKNEKTVIEVLLNGGADPDLGSPSAVEAMKLFKLEDEWKDTLEESRRRLKRAKDEDVEQNPKN